MSTMRKCCLLLALLWINPGFAQPANNDLLLSLYDQLQTLQREVQDLRGIIEQQNHELGQLKNEQRDRYLDIDRRLSALSGGTSVGLGQNGVAGQDARLQPGQERAAQDRRGTSPQGQGGNSGVAPVLQDPFDTGANGAVATQAVGRGATGPGGPASAGVQMDEQELYRSALALLLEQSEYEQAVSSFQEYVDRFPQGRLLTNAYYWQGEALILVGRLEQAQSVFMRIINDYPSDLKAAGAMLKLGVVYERLGQLDQAERTWQELPVRYPESATEIREAQNYLNRLRQR